MPVPVIFELRFAADLSAIAANPVGLARSVAPAPSDMVAPAIAAPTIATPGAVGPGVAVPRVAAPSVAAPSVAVPHSDPEPDPAPPAPPNDGLTGVLPEAPDSYPLASLTVAPSVDATPAAVPAPIAPPARPANRAAEPAGQPRAQPRTVRRAPSDQPSTTATANPLSALFGRTPQAPQ
jgi:hypothetical protein